MTDLEKQIREMIKKESQKPDPLMKVIYQNDAIHFTRGALFLMPLIAKLIEQRDDAITDSCRDGSGCPSGQHEAISEANKILITLLKGETK